MSEVEKMYKKVGVDHEERYNNCILNKEGECKLKCSCDICKYSEEKYVYPSFTKEKQLKILCFIVNNKHSVTFRGQVFSGNKLTLEKIQENLAWAINRIWQDLTEEERTEIRTILNG